ncbi:MAG: hypothetical protein KGN84_02865 [Acidobacteriota bacterium]|nr:hypothetical protein [Acidobacteriota bacterium]
MVPPGVTSLAGAHMDRIEATELYRKLAAQQKLPAFDSFARDTGFDPRRDVREILFANTATGGVLLARGTFSLHPPVGDTKPLRHGAYTIQTTRGAGFCILDATLAAAGDLKSVESALDEWTRGAHSGAQPLLAHAREIGPDSMFWAVSTTFTGFLADNIPLVRGGIDFSKIFRGLQNTWMEANFADGVKGVMHGAAATDQDAANLRDTAKGLVGLGRLSVPQDYPEMLRMWDGITVEQNSRDVTIRADIPQELVDQLVRMVGSIQGGRGRGPAPARPVR